METVTDFISWTPKSLADGDYSHEVKRHLILVQTRQHIKKQRYHFANKGL